MLGILKNKNIKNIKTVMQDDNIMIEMKLKNSISDMSKFQYSAQFLTLMILLKVYLLMTKKIITQ